MQHQQVTGHCQVASAMPTAECVRRSTTGSRSLSIKSKTEFCLFEEEARSPSLPHGEQAFDYCFCEELFHMPFTPSEATPPAARPSLAPKKMTGKESINVSKSCPLPAASWGSSRHYSLHLTKDAFLLSPGGSSHAAHKKLLRSTACKVLMCRSLQVWDPCDWGPNYCKLSKVF